MTMATNRRRVKAFRRAIKTYRSDPVRFAIDVMNFHPDPWQAEAMNRIRDNRRLAIKSGQGVGKTGIEAVLVIWFLFCFPYARVVCTAPTKQQLHDVLWSEIDKWITKSSTLRKMFKWTKTYVYLKGHEKRWFAVARTATKAENMQGFHEDNLLFIVDEASGVADLIMEAIIGTLSGCNNKLILMGNPTRSSGTFYDAFTRDRDLYQTMTVSSEDSPRTNKDNIAAMKRKYGENSNVVRVRVLGEFPSQEDDVFIPLTLIEQCSSRSYELPPEKESPFVILGCDVARFGDDETIVWRNFKGHCKIVRKRHGQDLMATVGDLVWEYRKIFEEHTDYYGKVYVQIDDTGLGGGVTDRLREVKREMRLDKMEIIPINAAEKIETDSLQGKKDAEHYNNLTTAMWATVRENLETKSVDIEDDEETVAQVSSRKYRMASNGKLEVEPKQDMKKRGLGSPDRGDALSLCLYLGKIKKHTGSPPTADAINALSKANYWGSSG